MFRRESFNSFIMEILWIFHPIYGFAGVTLTKSFPWSVVNINLVFTQPKH